MYASHVPVIAEATRSDPAIFERAVWFAVLSMRQPFDKVPGMMDDLDYYDSLGRGYECPHLFGFKRDAWAYTREHRDELHRDVLAAATNEARMHVLCRIHGMGLVKAGFVLQLMGYDVGCLDTRNVKREGRDPRAFRTDGRKSGAGFDRKVRAYLREVEGRAEYLWDTWCADVAVTYGQTAETISAWHMLGIVPENFIPF